jgi:PAS domain S-box-containing protein
MKSDPKHNSVLYVDDEPENLDGFRYSFRRDYLIYTTTNIKDAWEIIRKNKIKVILADQRMPDITGTQFFAKLSNVYPDIIRIIITAYADVDVILEAINKGQVYRFITKPWNKVELKVAIDNAILAFDLKNENQHLLKSFKKANQELNDSNSKLIKEIEVRTKAEAELAKNRDNLELLVKQRTEEVEKINSELKTANQQLTFANDELNNVNEELEIINITLEKEINIRKQIQKNLEESEVKFRSFIEQSTEGIILLDEEGQIIEWNKKMEEIIGLSRKETFNTNIAEVDFKILPEKEQTKEKYDQIKVLIKNYRSITHDTTLTSDESYCRTESGELKYLHTITFPVVTHNKKYIGRIVRDLTVQKQAAEELRLYAEELKLYKEHLEDLVEKRTEQVRENEQKLLNIFNSSSDAIIISDYERNFLDVNETFLKISGYEKQELDKIKSIDLFLSEYTSVLNDRLEKLKTGINLSHVDIEIRTKSGTTIPIELNSKLITHVGRPALLTIIRDITERRELEKRMLETMIQTEEKEREKFAGNLHDEVGPLLSSLKMYISLLSETEDKNKKAYIVPQIQTLIKESITAVREISNDLSPHVLNTYGCITAINSFIALKHDLIRVDFAQNIEKKRYSSNIEVIIYRIAKELINNSIKHANCKKVDIVLYEENHYIIFRYSDDGIGFEPNENIVEMKGGIGLLNIISRVKTVNGKYRIQTAIGKGFSFEMMIPV